MALQTFNNGDSNLDIRTKLNANTVETEKLIVKAFDFTATTDLASGSVTSQGASSITDNTKVWTVNQFAGKGVMLVTSAGEVDYTRIASNTATVLTFDVAHAGYTYATYRILPSFEVTNINSIVAVNILANDCAIMLPDVNGVENRKFIKVYLEQSNNNGKRAAIICYGDQKQRGVKYGFLNYKYESVEFWSHLVTPNHWDILSIENVKRYSGVTVITNSPVTTTGYATMLPFANVTLDTTRRFEARNMSGAFWFKYMSITALTMTIGGPMIITRTGGGTSVVTIAVRIKRFIGGATEDTTKDCIVKLSGDSTQTVSPQITFDLQPYDEVTMIVKRDTGTIVIEAGSSVTVKEV